MKKAKENMQRQTESFVKFYSKFFAPNEQLYAFSLNRLKISHTHDVKPHLPSELCCKDSELSWFYSIFSLKLMILSSESLVARTNNEPKNIKYNS